MATRFLARRTRPGRSIVQPSFKAGTGFEIVYECPGLTIWADRIAAAYRLPEGRGVVLGWAFSQRRVFEPGTIEPRYCTPRGLLGVVWGAYVAFTIDAVSGECCASRDPSGIMPCLRIAGSDTEWLVSDIGTAQAAGLTIGGVDWTGLAWHLQATALPLERTALAGVRELRPGFAQRLAGPSEPATPIWSPWSHVGDSGRGYHDMVVALHDTIEDCVGTWSEAFDRTILDLSGGLDSSVLAAILAGRDHGCRALTFAVGGGDDERHYARLAAAHCRLPLVEALLALDDVDILQPTFPELPVPIGRCIGQAMDAPRARLANGEGCDAYFNGVGGDNVFCYLQSAAPVADRWQAEGMGRGLWHSLQDVCALTGASMATVLRLARRQLRNRRKARSWQPYMALLDTACQAPAAVWRHPWLDAPEGALPGKVSHVAGLLRIPTHFHAFASGPDTPQISPLRSTPLVELCLSIPSWFWCRDGRNRAVVRDGFVDQLPAQILARRSKAGPETFCFEVLARDRSSIRERLLDGCLAREGILDRAIVETILAPDAPITANTYLRLLELVDAEAWIDQWMARTGPLPAAETH